MAKRLTDKLIEKLPVPERPKILWDLVEAGLGIKLTAHGRKIFVYQRRYPGGKAQSKRTLGPYPALSLGAAREKARQWRDQLAVGKDPREVEEEQAARAEAEREALALRKANTFASVAERFIAAKTGRRAKGDAQEIRRALISAWGPRSIDEIKPRDVRVLIERLVRKAPYDARNNWVHAVGIFKAAVHEELIDVSPCASLDRAMLFRGAVIAPRQRTLNDEEIFALWRAASRIGYPMGS